jgi:uncharacterized repeat protein (TIGR01451 family)
MEGKVRYHVFKTKLTTIIRILSLTGMLGIVAIPVSASPTLVPEASEWQAVDPPAIQTMYALDIVDANDVWASGAAGFVFHYDGTSWGMTPTKTSWPLMDIDMVDSDTGFAVGYHGTILRYDGVSWTVIPNTPSVTVLGGLHMLSETEGWAVGTGGTILHYTGGSWQVWPTSPVTAQLKSIDMLNASDGWAVGATGAIIRWNGAAWFGSLVVPGGVTLSSVSMVSPNNVWVVGGGGLIYHWNGASWTDVPSPTTETLFAVEMLSSTNGWAVGDNGTILHYDGIGWTMVDSPTSQSLQDVAMTMDQEGWAIGRVGTLLRYTPIPDISTSTKTVNPQQASAGDTLTYTVTIHNSGEVPAPSVVMTDTLDPGLVTYVPGSASTTQGTIQEPNPLVVNVGEIAPLGTVTITFQVTVVDQGVACWFLLNEATIGMGGNSINRWVYTRVGACYSAYLPLIQK